MERGTTPGAADDRHDAGFTLIELLIVIVIVGVLSTIGVFAVRGVADQGEESACGSELRILTTASETHAVRNQGTYADEAGLVAAEALASPSELYDVTVAFDGSYRIDPAPGSSCTGSAGGGGGGAPPPPPGPVTPTNINFGTIPAWQYGAGGNDEVVVFGRAEGEFDWLVTINEMPPTTRRVTFINLDQITDDGDIDYIMNRSRTNGVTDWAIYPGDDTVSIGNSGGGTWPNVRAYLSTVAAPDPYHQLSAGGFDFTDLLGVTG